MIFYEDERITVCHGDMLDVLRQLPDASLDSVVTDPPYGLEFMGKDWDRPWAVSPTQSVGFAGREDNLTLPSYGDNRNANCRTCGGRQRGKKRCECAVPKWDRNPSDDMRDFQAWCQQWVAECLRILKPGGYLLSFGGSRTFHRLACAIEDAGFEVRDTISWLYGSGFPKSMDVSKAIDKAAGAKREVVGVISARMPMAQANGWGNPGTDTFRDDRKGTQDMLVTAPATDAAEQWQGWGTALKPAWEPIVVARKPLNGTVANNVLTHGTGALNIDGCRTPMQDDEKNPSIARYKNSTPQKGNAGWDHVNRGARFDASAEHSASLGRWPANVLLDESQAEILDEQTGTLKSGDNNKRKKPHQTDAMAGTLNMLDREEVAYGDSGGASRFFPTFKYQAKAPKKERPVVDGVAHPTVKPLDLMRWLVRLVTPPGGWVLDPFGGSGTTGEAALAEGMCCVLIEREAEYLPLIKARIDRSAQLTIDQHAGHGNDTNVVNPTEAML